MPWHQAKQHQFIDCANCINCNPESQDAYYQEMRIILGIAGRWPNVAPSMPRYDPPIK